MTDVLLRAQGSAEANNVLRPLVSSQYILVAHLVRSRRRVRSRCRRCCRIVASDSSMLSTGMKVSMARAGRMAFGRTTAAKVAGTRVCAVIVVSHRAYASKAEWRSCRGRRVCSPEAHDSQ